jgi:uncharacterized membrane protein
MTVRAEGRALAPPTFPVQERTVSRTDANSSAAAADRGMAEDPAEGFLKRVTLFLARLAELMGALVIGVATLRSIGAYAVSLFRREPGIIPKEAIRLSLGRSLSLALEFETGADILKTAVAPTWNDIGQLAAIIVLRTALNYFLQQELERATPERASIG